MCLKKAEKQADCVTELQKDSGTGGMGGEYTKYRRIYEEPLQGIPRPIDLTRIPTQSGDCPSPTPA